MPETAQPPATPNPRRIHLYRPQNQLGDLLLNVPAIRAVRERFPDAHVTLVVGGQNADAVLGQPWADVIRVVRTRNFLGALRASIPGGPRPDLAIYFTTVSYSKSSAFLVARSGAPERVGFDPVRYGERDGARLTRVVPFPEGRAHQSEVSLALARAVGATRTPPPPYYLLDASLLPGIPEGIAYLHPGAGKLKNRWDARGFAAVAGELLARGLAVSLLEGPQDAGTVAAVESALGRSLPAVRGEAIPMLAARFARAVLYVGNDTGPLHLAGAVGCPTVGIYGWSDPAEWAPVGACVRSVRAPDGSLDSVTARDVLDAALPLLDEVPCGRA